jgi:hypothetical protein
MNMVNHAHVLALLALAAAAVNAAHAADDAQFRDAFQRRYSAVKNVAPDMVVMELRDRVELVASRGSQVGAASNDRRIRGFESALLRGLQAAQCNGTSSGNARPSPVVIEHITAAASAQRLRTQGDDVAELSALAQRLLDSQPRERWCALKSLDDIR